MTPPAPSGRPAGPGRRLASLAVAIAVAFAVTAPLWATLAAPAAAGNVANDAPYYEDEDGTVDGGDAWIPGDGNATATGLLGMIARVPSMFLGTGDPDPSGAGFEGVLLTGLVIAAAALFATVGAGVGPIAGSMLGMVLAYGLTAVGLIPVWIRPLLLFGLVGVPAAIALLRVFRR